MKKSEINFTIELDDDNIPHKIYWQATDQPGNGPTETKSLAISLWDHQQLNTLRIDLWTKDMPVNEMKRFYVDAMGGMAQNMLNATGDKFMSQELNALCDKFVEYLRKEGSENPE